MNAQLAQRIRECSALPTLPAIALQVLDLTQREDCDVGEIARVICSDPALSSKILRTVNSSFYTRTQKVSTISHALMILGLQSVKTLVLGFSLVGNLKGNGRPTGTFDHVAYWKRSIYAATAAKTIATRVPGGQALVQAEECFLAALLMDIGMLVLERVLNDEYGSVVVKARTHGALLAAENAALGMNHAEVAAMLAADWKLPPVLATPMAHHAEPDTVTDEACKVLTRVIHLAGRCADVFVEAEAAEAIKDVRDACKTLYKMGEVDCDRLLEEIDRRTSEIAPLFEVHIGTETYESILLRANERLVELTLTTQREAEKLLAQAASLKQRASTLTVQNKELRVRATTDALTGLANRGTFDLYLADGFSTAVSTGRPISLLIVDVDRFKNVNDTHGHQAGDEVLRALGALLASRVRRGDLAARYGGEEFALVLRDATRQQAAAVAEAVRRMIVARPVQHGQTQIPVTACVGVAAYEPGSPIRDPSQLLKAADLAVYAAKHAGRNCVKVFAPKVAA